MGRRRNPTAQLRSTARKIVSRQSGVVDVTIDDVSQQGEIVEVTITAEGPQTYTPFDVDVTIDVRGLDTIGSESASYAIERGSESITRTLEMEIGGPSEEEELSATIEAVATDPNGDTRSDSVSETLTNPTFAAEVTIEDCSVRTSAGDLLVDLETSTNTGELVERDVEVRVDGTPVLNETRDWPDGSTTTLSTPVSELPEGNDMPVEVGIGGNFSECGSVTVESDDPQDEPDDEPDDGNGSDTGTTIEDIQLSCSGLSDTETRVGEPIDAEYSVENTGSELAVVDIGLLVNGEQVDTVFESLNPDESKSGVVAVEIDERGDYSVGFEIADVGT